MADSKKIKLSPNIRPKVISRSSSKKQQFVSEIYAALKNNLNVSDKIFKEVDTLIKKGDKESLEKADRLLNISKSLVDSNKDIEKVVRSWLSEIG